MNIPYMNTTFLIEHYDQLGNNTLSTSVSTTEECGTDIFRAFIWALKGAGFRPTREMFDEVLDEQFYDECGGGCCDCDPEF